ncbi:hypothetical protein EGM51_09330 [Verrucomicrobia bacterium S94]|nr:hypothetical protein EGM51_09330 [Verrucomicrobia bacterium S94]
MGIRLSNFCMISALLWEASCALALNNPLPVRLDGAMVHYNGAYYALDGVSNGVMLRSGNLVDWREPIRVLPETVARPYELFYRNGLFHLYAQGQGYASAAHPLEPFSDLQKTGLSGNEMRMYQDSGGMLFSVNRRAGSKKEGEIWLQRYSKPWKAYGKPDQLLDGRRGMWDSLDSADLGEPEVVAYRGNYYLLYAANNPGPRTGLREVGVAVNENPLKFDNTDKRSDPVLRRNADRLSYIYKTILPTGEFMPWRGRYTTIPPEGDWMRSGYKYSKWRTGDGGFGSPDEVNGAQLHACRTKWDKGEYLWVRREFDLRHEIPETPVLNIRHEGAVQVFINGVKVYESAEPAVAYSNFDISEDCNGVFNPEENVIAVRVRVPEDAPVRFIDFGLFDAEELPVEPTVYGLTAPRLIHGPNGFEKWMLYQAWWNGKPGTGLDRVFFYDKELVVDGPTTAVSPGYHPAPVPPTFSDTFPSGEQIDWAERWMFSGGKWMSVDGAMRQSAPVGKAKAYLKQEPRMNYLFETGIRFPASGKGDVGVVAWSDGESDLIVSINPAKRTWSYHIEPGGLVPKKFKLPRTFRLLEKPPGMDGADAPLQRLRVTRNGTRFDVKLNGIDLLPGKPLMTKITRPGVPGFYCGNSEAEFDGVTYTVGWDEHDQFISGWGGAADGTRPSGEWRMHKALGLEQRTHSETGRLFKGDLLNQYEFTVNVRLEEMEEGKNRTYGIFPVFADRKNYLKAMIDTRARELVVTGKLDGREIKPVHRKLRTKVVHRHLYDKSTAYRNVTSWVYGLRSESVISSMDIRWLEGEFEHLRQEFLIPGDDMVIKYAKLDRGEQPNLWEDGRFYEADEPGPRVQKAGIFNPVRFRPLVGNYIGFGFYIPGSIVIDSRTGEYKRGYTPGESLGSNEAIGDGSSESDTMSRPQETVITLEVESSYFFRCVKLEDRVLIELNGRPMVEVEGRWPASQVGLVTEGQPAFYNGMMLYHIPGE